MKEIRVQKDLRQVNVARIVSIFQSEVFEIKTGKRKPSVYLTKRIAKALGVGLDDLFLFFCFLRIWFTRKLKTEYWIRF
ncbi:MAG: helix-turn-helix transcriptional regulator [Candidatus Bathyarchaeia archaeon]